MRSLVARLRTLSLVRRLAPYFGAQFFKAVVFGLALLSVQNHAFGWLSVTLFVLLALLMYIQPPYKTFSMLKMALLLITLSIAVTSEFAIGFSSLFPDTDLSLSRVLFSAMFGTLFYVTLGLKDLVLVHRKEWFALLSVSLLYGATSLFFTANIGNRFFVSAALLAIFFWFFIREYLVFYGSPRTRLISVYTATLTLLLMQLAWIVSLLPIGFSNAASLTTISTVVVTEILSRYARGILTARYVRLLSVFFFSLTLLIFGVSDWTL